MIGHSLKFSVATCLFAMLSLLSGEVTACTIGEETQVKFPPNTAAFSNADRVSIANIAIEAKKWPDVEIRAVVIAGAYISENDVDKLKDARAKIAKSYLQQFGIKSENILIDKKTFTEEMTERQPDGTIITHQMVVELTPICKGSCAWMCDDPRVSPRSKAVN